MNHKLTYRPDLENAVPNQDRAASVEHDVLLKEEEVARRQGRSVRTLQNQRVQGGGIPYLKLGRTVRYRLSDVIAWEEARRFSSTSEEGRHHG